MPRSNTPNVAELCRPAISTLWTIHDPSDRCGVFCMRKGKKLVPCAFTSRTLAVDFVRANRLPGRPQIMWSETHRALRWLTLLAAQGLRSLCVDAGTSGERFYALPRVENWGPRPDTGSDRSAA